MQAKKSKCKPDLPRAVAAHATESTFTVAVQKRRQLTVRRLCIIQITACPICHVNDGQTVEVLFALQEWKSTVDYKFCVINQQQRYKKIPTTAARRQCVTSHL